MLNHAFRRFFTHIVVGLFFVTTASAEPPMVPMQQVGPQPIRVDEKLYAHIVKVAPDGEHKSVSGALAAVKDASATNRYAILVAAGTYNESRVQLKPYVDLYGGFAAGDWKKRDVYQNAAILDGQKKGPVVLGADNARLDGFVVTGGEQNSHGGGILCVGTSPSIVNNIIIGNHLFKPDWLGQGLGKQVCNEGAGIALFSGSKAYVCNNLICENVTDAGNGAGITARGNVKAKILRNVFCNNIAGAKDDSVFHGKVGSRSSPGAAIAVSDRSSPQISFNVMVMNQAVNNNDAGGVWVEGNSTPPISYNWIVGNLAGDDGGGIYVMGDIYFDEQKERHDTSPDAPVDIDDNIIVGNDNVRGGPGGIRLSRWGRANVRRNVIVANPHGTAHGGEGGMICIMEDNTVADNSPDSKPSFRQSGNISSRKFDQRHFVTEIVAGADFGKESLAGAVVRIGGQWSIVKSTSGTNLHVWGKITDEAKTFQILNEYAKDTLPNGH